VQVSLKTLSLGGVFCTEVELLIADSEFFAQASKIRYIVILLLAQNHAMILAWRRAGKLGRCQLH
jgi:hypothetical protein